MELGGSFVTGLVLFGASYDPNLQELTFFYPTDGDLYNLPSIGMSHYVLNSVVMKL